MKHKVGDKVRVKQLEDINKIFEIDENDSIGMPFLRSYEPYCGNIYKVKVISGCHYYLENEDGQSLGGFFTEEMVEDINESSMRYKVGDKVRVRQWEDMVKEFGVDEFGDINTTGTYFLTKMKEFCGGVYEIRSVLGKSYWLKDGDESIEWYFTDDMLEDVNLFSYAPDSLTLKTEDISIQKWKFFRFHNNKERG